MRLALVSDIHGNITGMRAVLDAIKGIGGADKLVVAGDVVTGSSGNSDLMDLMLDHGAEIIRGNAEDFLGDPDRGIAHVAKKHHPYMLAWHDWLSKRLSSSEWKLLTESPLCRRYELARGCHALVCHAEPQNPWAKVCAADVPTGVLKDVFCRYEDSVVAYGHNHSRHILYVGGKMLVNVASVGLRRDGISSFTILEGIDGHISVKQYEVPYDVSKEADRNREHNIPLFEELVK